MSTPQTDRIMLDGYMRAIQTYTTARGWLTKRERDYLRECVTKSPLSHIFKAPFIVNIGVEFGASIVCLRAGRQNLRIFGIDIDMSNASEDVLTFKNVALLQANSQKDEPREWLKEKKWVDENPSAGVIFIDGDHSYDGVIADCKWADEVMVGGYVLFHDCYEWIPFENQNPKYPILRPNCEAVSAAVSDWLKTQPEEKWEELAYVDSMRVFIRRK